MPSPFPGMDPYLEESWWGPLHASMLLGVRNRLMPRLLPTYFAFIEKYELSDTLASLTCRRDDAERRKIIVQTPQCRIEIRRLSDRRLVTVVEFLSPTKKRGEGRVQYLEQRSCYLRESINLVEIDLLRHGLSIPVGGALPSGDYFALLTPAGGRSAVRIQPIFLCDPLPTIEVPLEPGQPTAIADLQAAFTEAYDSSCFDLVVDYAGEPEVSMSEPQREWTARVLKAKGLRKRLLDDAVASD